MCLYWLREGLFASTRKLAKEIGIPLTALRALRDGARKPTMQELDRMDAYARKMVTEGKIRAPKIPYPWDWSVISLLDDAKPRERPVIQCYRDLFR
jgi:hypothetical protein